MNGPMRCDDVRRALAVPTADSDPEALTDHLAGCPGCARFAEDTARLDALWLATRPAEPSAATWDRLWTGVAARLDAAERETVTTATIVSEHRAAAADGDLIPFPAATPRGPGWRSGLLAFALAQAAMLLIGFGLLLARAPEPLTTARLQVDIEPGEVVTIWPDGQIERRDAFTETAASPNMLDDNYAMLNALEAMAKAKEL